MAYRRYDVARYLVEHGADTSLKNKTARPRSSASCTWTIKSWRPISLNFFIKRGFDVRKYPRTAHLLNEAIGERPQGCCPGFSWKKVYIQAMPHLPEPPQKDMRTSFRSFSFERCGSVTKGILRAACGSGNLTIVKTLVEKGQQPSADDIDFALYKGSAQVALFLNTLLKKSKGQEVDLRKRCGMEPNAGPCKALFDAGYYDPAAKTCRTFIYGGCNGTVPFETVEACRKVCEESK